MSAGYSPAGSRSPTGGIPGAIRSAASGARSTSPDRGGRKERRAAACAAGSCRAGPEAIRQTGCRTGEVACREGQGGTPLGRCRPAFRSNSRLPYALSGLWTEAMAAFAGNPHACRSLPALAVWLRASGIFRHALLRLDPIPPIVHLLLDDDSLGGKLWALTRGGLSQQARS
ncbi:MAG: hypothetical protein H6Q05_1214 [Acidobacteria bacterium]|nr:hypothetical protein [Acidobacteriota bacterium]